MKLTNSVALINDLTSAVNTIKSDPNRYWATLDNGVRYTNFSVSSWPQQARYFKYVNASELSEIYVPLEAVEFKAYVKDELLKLGLSSEFNRYVFLKAKIKLSETSKDIYRAKCQA